MAEGTSQSGTAAVADAAAPGLSQLVGRILGQLSLSAWLPSAALTLMTAYVLALGNVLDGPESKQGNGPLGPAAEAFQRLGAISVGAVVLLVAVIVVLTMVTQAFGYESIRLLEGYWGVGWRREILADKCCAWQRQMYEMYQGQQDDLWKAARCEASDAVDAMLQGLGQRPLNFSDRMLRVLQARLNETPSRWLEASLRPSQRRLLNDVNWLEFSLMSTRRRIQNLQSRLADFPEDPDRTMPTRLGNILRRYEDMTGVNDVRGLGDRVYTRLPFSLQVTYDEQRSRLDLYCVMVFVWASTAAFAAARFELSGGRHHAYTLVAIGLGAVGITATYRAAMAAARYYGPVLVEATNYLSDDPQGTK